MAQSSVWSSGTRHGDEVRYTLETQRRDDYEIATPRERKQGAWVDSHKGFLWEILAFVVFLSLLLLMW